MATPSQIPESPTARVILSLHTLYIEIEHEAKYPDQISDMASRAYDLYCNALQGAKNAGIDIRVAPDYDFDIDEED